MQPPTLLQTGPESFTLLRGDGRQQPLTVTAHARRGLGLHGVPPLAVATEAVLLLEELAPELLTAADGDAPLDVVAALGREPTAVEELRIRLQ